MSRFPCASIFLERVSIETTCGASGFGYLLKIAPVTELKSFWKTWVFVCSRTIVCLFVCFPFTRSMFEYILIF